VGIGPGEVLDAIAAKHRGAVLLREMVIADPAHDAVAEEWVSGVVDVDHAIEVPWHASDRSRQEPRIVPTRCHHLYHDVVPGPRRPRP
jgi:hypothetical protein